VDAGRQAERGLSFLLEIQVERRQSRTEAEGSCCEQALAMKCSAEIYSASSRPYCGLPDLTYPLHDRDFLVTACGRIRMHRKRVNITWS
jgi:hypothetical protein